MTSLVEKLYRKAIFELKLDNGKIVYMSIECTNYMNNKRYIIIVDATKFLALWQNEPNPLDKRLNFGNKETWKADYKYHQAEQGFYWGKTNPVPLANIVCYVNENNLLPYVAFINGITRTIWLLSNGAKYFPVECREENSAKLLCQVAGYKDSDICTVTELLNCIEI